MSNASFAAVVRVVASYVGEAKAEGLVERRLAKESITSDQFALAQLTPALQMKIVSAASLYFLDASREPELKLKLAALGVS
jgi:hypothetical protein